MTRRAHEPTRQPLQIVRDALPVPARAELAVADRTFTGVLAQLRTLEYGEGEGVLDVAGVAVALTDLAFVLFRRAAQTKGDLLRYYVSVAGVLLPALADRPTELVAVPGTRGDPESRVGVSSVDTLARLIECVQLGAVCLRPWCARLANADSPDYVALTAYTGTAAPNDLATAGRWIEEELATLGLNGVPVLGGSRTLHVLIPMPAATHESAARLVGELVASRVIARHPGHAVLAGTAANPATDALVTLRVVPNALERAAIAAYSVLPDDDASVAAPVEWRELEDALQPRAITMLTMPPRLAARGDLWGDALARSNSLARIVRPSRPRVRRGKQI